MIFLYADGAFIGSEWTYCSDIIIGIEVTSNGYQIRKIEEGVNPSDADIQLKDHVLFPSFINSHIHIADTIGKDMCLNSSLEDAVGQNGIKFRLFEQNDTNTIKTAILNSLLEIKEAGISAFADFREGGLFGIQILREALEKFGKKELIGLIFGRPSKFGSEYKEIEIFHHEISNLLLEVDGLGLSSITDFTDEQLETMRTLADTDKKYISIHALEGVKNTQNNSSSHNKELERILDILKADILIHLTKATREDLYSLNEIRSIIFCPRSNAYFGFGFPPLAIFLKADLAPLPALGTDNIMCNAPNILEEARYAALSIRSEMKINPTTFLKMISVNPAKIFNLKVGILELGTMNCLALNLNSPRIKFSKDLKSALLFRSTISDYFSPFELLRKK
ncbi:MAG: amidohydrolase family protein [Promethearchaeota archaeon]